MLTPQKKIWSLTPHKTVADSNPRNPSNGKSVSFIDEQPPPLGSLGENGRGDANDEDNEVWTKFRAVGLLDEASLEMKDRQALVDRLSKLENELFEYQYNMGLLLIEKKEWTSKHEELRQGLEESQEILKREHVSHINAISEVKKREENLQKALGVEKQCVADLERALREMRAQSADTKYTSDSKMAEAQTLFSSIEAKSLEVEAKLHAAGAKLAEANRKNADMDRKLKEVEIRESSLRSERQSISAEQELNEATFSKQREELRDWEKMLQEREERLIDGRNILNQREERANENDMILKKKDKDLEAAQKTFEITNAALTKKEDDINTRIARIAAKEREADAIKHNLEVKQKELAALEEKLNVKERVEIQNLIEKQKANLDSEKQKCELELELKRKSLDAELKSKVAVVEQKESEVNHMEEKFRKREQALEKKMEKFKVKEKDLEAKSKALKDREKSIKAEEKNLEKKEKEMKEDAQNLQDLLAAIETRKAIINEEELRLLEEREKLKVTEEERNEHVRLKLELKQEIQKCKDQEEALLKEYEDLKQDRDNFEREWEGLDERRGELAQELKRLSEEKESLGKYNRSEEERLKNEKFTTENLVQKDLEHLRLEKESFATMKKHVQSAVYEKAQREHEDVMHQLELRKRELEVNMQNKLEKAEKQLRERERAFEEQKEREDVNIKHLNEVAASEMEELRLERIRIAEEKARVFIDKQHLQGQQLDMQRDIDNLFNLIKMLKEQRAQFKKHVEKYKSCKNCGEVIDDVICSDLQHLQEREDSEVLPSPSPSVSEGPNTDVSPVGLGYGAATSGGGMSWLRKCTTKIINLSPLKRSKDGVVQSSAEELLMPAVQVQGETEISPGLLETAKAPEAPFRVPSEFFDVQKIQPGDNVSEVQSHHTRSAGDSLGEVEGQHTNAFDENLNSDKARVPEDSQQSELKNSRGKAFNKRNAGVWRTHSVKAVVEESKLILSEPQEQNGDDRQENGNVEISSQTYEESRDDSGLADQGTKRAVRKRNHAHPSRSTASEQDHDEADTRSDSVTAGVRRKRQQSVAPSPQRPGEKRYNLRRPKTVGRTTAIQSSDLSKEEEADVGKATEVDAFKPVIHNSESAHEEQVVALETQVKEVYELSSNKMFAKAVENAGGNADSPNVTTNVETSDEVNGITEGTGEYVDEDGYESEVRGEGVHAEGDEDDDEDEHPGEASMKKKIWKFFTT